MIRNIKQKHIFIKKLLLVYSLNINMSSKQEKEAGWEKLEEKTKESMFTKLKQMFLPSKKENNQEKYVSQKIDYF